MNRLLCRPAWCAFTAFFIGLSLIPSTARSQGSARVASANLNDLVENAHTIVRGNVVSAIVQPHPQFDHLQTVLVTFAVAKTLKGTAPPTLTFRQFVWDIRDASAGYRKSQEFLLFLNPVSSYGLTSPVGMEQGRFRVLRDSHGNRFALNGRGNLGLFSGVAEKSASRGVNFSAQARAMLAQGSGQVSLASFEETIQALAAVRP